MFNLEKSERIALVILIGGLLMGLGTLIYQKINSADNLAITRFNIDTEKEKININEADSEGLARLKGVGPQLADRIVEYRSSNGAFADISDIKKVKGIGEKLFDHIKDDIST